MKYKIKSIYNFIISKTFVKLMYKWYHIIVWLASLTAMLLIIIDIGLITEIGFYLADVTLHLSHILIYISLLIINTIISYNEKNKKKSFKILFTGLANFIVSVVIAALLFIGTAQV